MGRTYRFVQVDVFTDRIFGGNQLAVFLEPDGLTTQDMQAIAREMNFAETTFVFPPNRPDAVARIRIFTPATELPFAGHPTVGTAWVLANEGRLPRGGREHVLEEGIGPVPVQLEGELSAPSTVWMSQREADFGSPVADAHREAIAEALGLSAADLLPDQPICTGSTGVQFLYVPLATPQTVDNVRADVARAIGASRCEASGVFVFAPDPERGRNRVYSRMFGSAAIGVAEDAATGSASGPLGAYVVNHHVVPVADPVEVISLQGKKMGRPSTIRIRMDVQDDRATRLRVGGGVVPVLEGTLRLP